MSGPGARRQRRQRDSALSVAFVLMAVAGIGLVARSGLVLVSGKRLPSQYSVAASVPAAGGRKGSVTPAPTSGAATSPIPDAKPEATYVSAFVPISVRIPGLEVSAPVVGVTSDAGALIPPDRPQTVGWWLGGTLAGADTGTTVIVGHIDSATRGLGALFHLDQVKAGDSIELAAGHSTAAYRVVSLHFYVKTAGLPRSLFTRTGPPRLAVISCGGTFDRAKHSYRENVVAVAEPFAR